MSALARRFGVSPAHVLAALADAEAGGLIRRDGGLEIPPGLRDPLERVVGSAFLFNAACVRSARA